MNHIPLHARFVNLQSLIVFLAFLVTLVTLNNGFYASYKVQRVQLVQQALETNHAYTQKLASATDNFISATHTQLAYTAQLVAGDFSNLELLNNEVQRFYLQTNSFGSAVVVNAQGVILAASSNIIDTLGNKSGSVEALQARKPTVSMPYYAADGHYTVQISSPVFDDLGDYLGYVAVSIYLEETNILNDLLGMHYHEDGSYIYVVDSNKQIIYHRDSERIGSYVLNNPAINTVVEGNSGHKQLTNSQGIEMLAGFTPIASTGWGVIAQRPLEATLSGLDHLILQVATRTVPLALLTFVFVWVLARYVSRPLRQLASTAVQLGAPDAHKSLVRIKPWYREIHELKQAFLKGLGLLTKQINKLKEDAETDALTGAVNRRSLKVLLEQLESKGIEFSVLAVDIDHFKKVNDTFGHQAGDLVLVELVRVMDQLSREQDVVARTGGEEFLLILPDTAIGIAQVIAERLRDKVERLQFDLIGSITVSIGVSASTETNRDNEEILRQADEALYQAKSMGRNRCEVYV